MTSKPTCKPLWRRLLKILLWTLASIVLLILLLVLTIFVILGPKQLTPIAERMANNMLDAEVSIGRVELSLHGSAPFARVRVDSLQIISTPMQRLRVGGAEVPAAADTLLCVDAFEGNINLTALIAGRIALGDVVIDGPRVNTYNIDSIHGNYMIFGESTATEEPSDGSMPDISISHFAIVNPKPIRYVDLSTGDDVTLTLSRMGIDSNDMPGYTLGVSGDVATPLLDMLRDKDVRFGIDGSICWSPDEPMKVALSDFIMTAAQMSARADTRLDFSNEAIIESLDLKVEPVCLDSALAILGDSVRHEWGLDRLSGNVSVGLSASLDAPYNLLRDTIPHARLTVDVLPGKMAYGPTRLNNVSGCITAILRGKDLNAATVDVSDLKLRDAVTDLTINVSASRLLADPLLRGTVRGAMALHRLPRQLLDMVGGALGGRLTADISFVCSPSMFDRNQFHRLQLHGDIDGSDLRYAAADTSMSLYAHRACFTFGTNNRVGDADSLLTAVIKVDSADIVQPDASLRLIGFKAGVGASNRNEGMVRDTIHIIPMGGDLSCDKFVLTLPEEHTSLKMRGTTGRVTIQRYANDPQRPLFTFDLGLNRLSFGSETERLRLRDADIRLSAHQKDPRPQRRRGNRRHIGRSDSLPQTEVIDWEIDDTLRTILNRWDIQGSINARSAGLYTASFPIRNRIRNLNATFNTDSVVMRNVRYSAGASDFVINGSISDIRRSLTSRRGRRPLRIRCDIASDTIDINQIVGTFYRGAAAAEALRNSGAGIALSDNDDFSDADFDNAIDQALAEGDSIGPLLIPTNIDLKFNMHADNIVYGDMLMHNFAGQLEARDGAINLSQLHAATDAGSVDLSALYIAPRIEDMYFGFGMQVNRFNIKKFMNLMPALDSIMPLMRDLSGIINADIAATCNIDRNMNFVIPSMTAAVKIAGDSLELIDPETYRSIGKWLLFKDKQNNIIDHLSVELTVSDNMMRMYPFIFNIDRYRLGVQGHNDLDMNFDYHIAVLKSPLPFKFGINIKGNPDKYKIRLGRARLNAETATQVAIADTTRINLVRELEGVFRRGVANARPRRLNIDNNSTVPAPDESSDTISAADSAIFIREGLIEAPPQPIIPTKK